MAVCSVSFSSAQVIIAAVHLALKGDTEICYAQLVLLLQRHCMQRMCLLHDHKLYICEDTKAISSRIGLYVYNVYNVLWYPECDAS